MTVPYLSSRTTPPSPASAPGRSTSKEPRDE